MAEGKGGDEGFGYELEWARPRVEGTPPSARGGHTTVSWGTNLIIFGGHYYGGKGAARKPQAPTPVFPLAKTLAKSKTAPGSGQCARALV